MTHTRLYRDPLLIETLFVIPDIGGYTRFMLQHKKTPEHAQKLVRELMEAMLRERQLPLRISEFEGDAVLLYAIKESEQSWQAQRLTIASSIENFFVAFESQLNELLYREHQEVSGLRIKIIVHYGHALLDRLEHFTTLTGVDVIIVHRLLKNSLRGTYLLVTKPAFEACAFPHPERFIAHTEHYPDVGDIKCFLYHA